MRSAAASGERPERERSHQPAGQDREVRAHARVEHRALHRAHAEYENRNVEGQDQKRDQRAAPAAVPR